MSTAIIIMARKNSIRIPHKNMKLFCRKPLIYYTCEIAKELDYQTYLISDYEDLKKYVNKNYNFCIVDEPYKYSTNKFDPRQLMKWVYRKIKEDTIILLSPTCPIRDIELIRRWISIFYESKADAGFSIYRMPEKLYYVNGIPLNFEQSKRAIKGFEVQDIHYENGSFYIFKRDQMLRNHILTGITIQFPDRYGLDIDYPIQWESGEVLYRSIHANENNC